MIQKKNKNFTDTKNLNLAAIRNDLKLVKKLNLSKFKVHTMTYNFLYYYSKYWELGNSKNFHKDFVKLLPVATYLNFKILKFKKKYIKKYLIVKYVSTVLLKLLLNWIYFNTKKNFLIWKRTKKNYKNFLIYGFLLLWCTKNNFFVTIMDNWGNTLSTRSGGNSGWTNTRQRANAFSAENAMYECCSLAKDRGLEAVHVHIKSSLGLTQIKYSLEGIKTAGIKTLTVIYCPLKSFGGCREKKPRWI